MSDTAKQSANAMGASANNLRAAVLLAATISAVPAMAETAAGTDATAGSALDEVVVTAQRRSQNLQDVPVTVSAVTGDVALARGITEVSDLPVLAPGLTITREVGNDVIYMRGVGNNNSTAGQEQNIAIYVDGVYYPSMSSDPGSFTNLERIEVLKGPQGTLFGRNTTGGLVQFVTKDPTQEFHGNASVGYGNFGTTDASMYVTGGLTTNLAADLMVAYHNQAIGWGTNLFTGQDIDRARNLDFRSKWVYTPFDGTKVTFTGGHTELWTDQGVFQQILTSEPLPALGGNVYPGNHWNANQNVSAYYTVGQSNYALRIDQDLGLFKIAAISAYQSSNRKLLLDLDVTPAPALAARDPNLTTSFSQELQLSSNPGKLNWVVGAMYFYMNGRQPPLAILAGPTELAVAEYYTGQKTDSLAGYGQVTLPLGDTTDLTVGGRYTEDRQELYGALHAFNGAGYTIIGANPDTNTANFGNFTWKVALDHHFTENFMGYASISTGFKSGVYNITFANPSEAPVKPEKLTDYEVGFKSELFDRRLRLNMDAFYYNYKDLQLQTYIQAAIVTLNAAAARVYGAEADFAVKLTPGLELTGGVSELHSEYRDFNNVPSYDSSSGLGVPILGLSGSGNQLLRTPDLTGNLSLDYKRPVSFGTLGVNTTLYHTSTFFFEPDNRLHQPTYNLVNGQMSWTSLSDRYTVRLWSKNMFNRQYSVQKISGANAPDVGSPGAPRTYGVSVGVKF
jgi:iron complex outermembrane receptor protein